MKTLILKVLLCPDLHLSKISQLTLIFQKGSLVRKNAHFNPCWYESFPWLHYDLEKDVVLYAICVSQEKKGNLTLSSKKEDAFLSTGFRIGRKPWKNLGNAKVHALIWKHQLCQLFERHTETLEKCSVILEVKKNLRTVGFF